MVAFVYALLPNKEHRTYRKLLLALKDLAEDRGLEFKPKALQIDFERGAKAAIDFVFPTAALSGCLFHYSQAIYRKVQSLGLVTAFRTNPNVSKVSLKLF